MTWAYAAESSSDYALLKLVADNGAVGIAEGVIKATRTGYSPRSLAATMEDVLLPLLRGVDLADSAAVSNAFQWLDGNLAGRALIDNACWAMRELRNAGIKPRWQLSHLGPRVLARQVTGRGHSRGRRAVHPASRARS